MFKTTDDIVNEVMGAFGRVTIFSNNKVPSFSVDETHFDTDGGKWHIIGVFDASLYAWLEEQCEVNEEKCGRAFAHHKFTGFTRYNIHATLLAYITLRWT
jgi:hypothetical protein